MSTSYYSRVTWDDEEREYPLDQPVTTFGRSTDNVVILDDTQISRHHAKIEWITQTPHITDLGSSNGVFVNGAQISPDVPFQRDNCTGPSLDF